MLPRAPDGTPVDDALLADMGTFARPMVTSWDIDPIYPALAWLASLHDEESAIWLVYLYLTHYNLTSALTVHNRHPYPHPIPDDLARLPTGTERRNLRGGKTAAHVAVYLSVVERHGSQAAFWNQARQPGRTPHGVYLHLRNLVEGFPGNGRWAGYKAADLFRWCLGWDLDAAELGAADASGPVHGLETLYRAPRGTFTARTLVDWCEDTGRHLTDVLSSATGLDLAVDQTETLLCDFKSLVAGAYYVGHDIDLMWEQTAKTPDLSVCGQVAEARAATLPAAYLTEARGDSGVDKARKRHYADTGEVLTR